MAIKNSSIREEYHLNDQFRMQRRLELVQRLREQFAAGKTTDKVNVAATRNFLGNFSTKPTKEECGRIVKLAFPGVCRRRSNAKWYYYGLQEIDGKAKNLTSSTPKRGTTVEQECENVEQAACNGDLHQHTATPSPPKRGAAAEQECENGEQATCSGDLHQHTATPSPPNRGSTAEQECENVEQAACSGDLNQHTATLSPPKRATAAEQECENVEQAASSYLHQQAASSPASEHFRQQQLHANLRPFSLPYLNLCKEDMSDLANGQLIGEGTFGQCITGTYKGVPAAFKIFKDLECIEDVHTEAKILLKIPSHPGIPMLIGIHTTSVPFILATKLCESDGKPQTFSKFLKEEELSKNNLSLSLQLLLSVGEALNHLFSVGILHNDIKGNNVVLEDVHGVKRSVLIDFGKACYIQNAKESTRHKLMNFNERRQYRERYPHVAPELSNGDKPTPSSDIYSFGHMYCLTMKKMKGILGDQRNELLELGKQMSHFRPQKRPRMSVALKELAHLSTTFSLS